MISHKGSSCDVYVPSVPIVSIYFSMSENVNPFENNLNRDVRRCESEEVLPLPNPEEIDRDQRKDPKH